MEIRLSNPEDRGDPQLIETPNKNQINNLEEFNRMQSAVHNDQIDVDGNPIEKYPDII